MGIMLDTGCGCTLNGAYVADGTVPDDTGFAPGEVFTKVWRVRNSGTCTWGAGTQLVFAPGERYPCACRGLYPAGYEHQQLAVSQSTN
jgi:hypothetical protein